MMALRKRIALLCAAVMGCAALAGCSSTAPAETEKPAETAAPADSTEANDGEGTGSDTAVTEVDWPKKSIQVIVPFGAGGDTDFNARTIAKYLEKSLGQPVVISNVTGSGGTIGASKVKEAAADGYTMLFTHVALNISTAAGVIDYSYKDFQMGGIAARSIGDAVLVSGDSPWNSIEDMIADTKANPGKYKIAANTGATTHWVAIAMQQAGAEFNVVNSGSASERIPALLGGHVDVICNSLSSVQDYLKTGQFKALAVCNSERASAYPDIPTLGESGVDCTFYCAYTFFFPQGTDQAIAEKFNAAVKEIVENNTDYQNEIMEAYQQEPFCLGITESEEYYSKELDDLMAISDALQGK